jgi:hypothetical protein
MQLKKLFYLLFLAPVAVLPTLFTTSCSAASKTKLVTFDRNSFDAGDNKKSLYNFKTVGTNVLDLVMGGRKYYDGNFILFVGTNSFNSKTTNLSNFLQISSRKETFFDPNVDIITNDILAELDIVENKMPAKLEKENKPKKRIGVFVYMENDLGRIVPDHKFSSSGNRIAEDYISSPFEKWSQLDENKDGAIKDVVKDEWSKNHRKDAYCRNDPEAVAYRDIVKKLSILFKEDKFDSNKTFGTFG